MKKKVIFIVCGIIVPILFVILLILAIIFSIVSKNNEIKETIEQSTEITSVFKDMETSSFVTKGTEQTQIEEQNPEPVATEYEVEELQSDVPITNLAQDVVNYLGDDKALLPEKINEFIIGYGYQNAEEIRLEESELDEEKNVFIMTFILKTHLYKDPYLVVKYEKESHMFDIQIW